MAGGQIRIVSLTKAFGHLTVVDGVDLQMRSGEFFSMVGPSGCGKTTTLRMIAGFEQPTAGQIMLDDVDMQFMPPHKRNVNTVFQSYALFPHLDVYNNVAFGLRRRRCQKDEVRRRVSDILDLVQLGGLADRRPTQLSGGQQQRVALARALVLNPSVLLLDEPLGALDAKLRKRLQIDLKALQQNVGITFVYVTHDQEEALTMSDRIAVMNHGQVEQVGTPREVYEDPATEFVADFLGVSNLLDVDARGRDGDGCCLQLGDFRLHARRGDVDVRGRAKCVIRPERLKIEPSAAQGANLLPGVVERFVYVGSVMQVVVRLVSGQTVQVLVQNDGTSFSYAQATSVMVRLPADALHVLQPTAAAHER